jgi:hypothetical protein
MTGKHDAKHEELLEAFLTGEPVDDAARSELESCPTCSAELDELRGALDLLDDAGTQERSVFDAMRAMPAAPGDQRVGPTIHGLAETPPSRPGGSGRPGRLMLVGGLLAIAAAVLLFVLIGPLADPGSDGGSPGGIILGPGDDLRCVGPVGPVERYDVFRWDGELPAGHGFVVEVRRPDAGVLDDPLLESPLLADHEWTPTEARLSALPAAILWRVSLRDESGRRVGSSEAQASLR